MNAARHTTNRLRALNTHAGLDHAPTFMDKVRRRLQRLGKQRAASGVRQVATRRAV
jgi:hypothetical protein